MVRKNSKDPKISSQGLVIFLFFFILSPLCADEFNLDIKLFPEKILQMKRFTLVFTLDYSYPDQVDIIEPGFPSGIQLLSGPYKRPFVERDAKGELVKKTKISYVFRSQGTGRYVFNGFIIRAGQNSIRPKAISFFIFKNNNLDQPVAHELEWELATEDIYAGQTFGTALVLSNLASIQFPKKPFIAMPRGCIFEEKDKIFRIKNEKVEDSMFFSVPVAEYLMTPISKGKIYLPAVNLNYHGNHYLEGRVLEVLETPLSIKESLAYGDLSMKSRLQKEIQAKRLFVKIEIELKGQANFKYLNFPQPLVNNQRIDYSKSQIIEDLSPDWLFGYKGSVKKIFHYWLDPEKKYLFSISSFPVFNPYSKKQSFIGNKIWSVNPDDLANEVKSDEQDSESIFIFSDINEIRQLNHRPLWRSPFIILVFLLPLLLFILFIFNRRIAVFFPVLFVFFCSYFLYQSLDEQMLAKISQALENENFVEADKLSMQILEKHPYNPALWYNSALCKIKTNQNSAAVFALRQSILLRPMNYDARKLLRNVEKETGIDKPLKLVPAFDLDIFLYFIFLFELIVCFFLALWVKTRSPYNFIVSISSLLILSALIISFIIFYGIFNQKSGVVKADYSYLAKVPEKEAVLNTKIDAGTSFNWYWQTGNFLYIETGFFIDGWIKIDDVYLNGFEEEQYGLWRYTEPVGKDKTKQSLTEEK